MGGLGGCGWGVRGAGDCLSEAWIAPNTAFSILVSHENHRGVLRHKGVSNLESGEVLPWGRFFHTSHPTFTVITDWKLIVAFIYLVPRSGPRNLRVFGETTNSLSVAWDHADGPVQQYRIIYSPTVGDPIDEYVSLILIRLSILFCSLLPVEG